MTWAILHLLTDFTDSISVGKLYNANERKQTMKDYFVNDNVKRVKLFSRLHDAREFADTLIGENAYLPGYLITSQDDEKTYFIESKDFNWSLTTEDIRRQARAALMREKTGLCNAILANKEKLSKCLQLAFHSSEELTLASLCVYVLGSGKYGSLKRAYCCGDNDMVNLCREAIKGTRYERIIADGVKNYREKQKQGRARIEKLMAIG